MNHCTICGVYWRDSHLCKLDSEGEVETEESVDMVNKPRHYRAGGMECIDAMVAAFGRDAVETYCQLAAFKYIWRAEHKGTRRQDLEKAAWYLRFAAGDDPRQA